MHAGNFENMRGGEEVMGYDAARRQEKSEVHHR